jgi:hypothetical protein
MRITTFLMAVLSAALILLAADTIAKDVVYRWVDENGVVHFVELPDDQANAEPVEIRKSPPSSSQSISVPASIQPSQPQEPEPSYAQQRRDERARKRKEASLRQQDIDAGCQQRRQIVARMEPSTRVMVQDEDGNVHRLDDNERLESLDEAKAYIAEKCNP